MSRTLDNSFTRICNLEAYVGAGKPHEMMKFVVPVNDEYVGASICARGEWQRDLLIKMAEYIKPGTTVLDIGANIGAMTIQFSHLTGPSGKVLSFEPQYFIYEVLSANILGLALPNVKAYKSGLSFKHGVASMVEQLPDGANTGKNFTDALSSKSTINFGGRNIGKGGEHIRLNTLDSLNVTGISFMKIDVQGAENLMLYGARETILRELPTINVEDSPYFTAKFATQESIELLGIPLEVQQFKGIEWLKSIGYRLTFQGGEDLIFEPPPRNVTSGRKNRKLM